MQVILIEQVKSLGTVGDVVKVRDGYARNFLIPNKKALRATKDNIAYFEARKAEIQKEAAAKAADAEKASGKLKGAVSTLIRQAGEDGRLYGSVKGSDVAKAFVDAGFEVDRKQVVLHQPIKYIGVHAVELDLHAGVSAVVHINVARSEDEAADAARRFARGEVVMEGQDKRKQAANEDEAAEEVKAEEAPAAEAAEGEEAKAEKPKKKAKKKADAEEAA